MTDVDEIEEAAALAEAQTGVRGGKLRLCLAPDEKENARRWTADEDSYIRENLGRVTEQAIADHLGRSVAAVHIRWTRELLLVAPTKDPRLLTAEHVSMGLCIDGHSVHKLMDRGLMPHWRLPGGDLNRVVDRHVFLRWITEPMHWCYFKPARVGAMEFRGKRGFTGVYDYAFWEEARQLVAKARAQWKGEWLTPGQVAAIVDVTDTRLVNRAIRRGLLKATRWGNWWILRDHLPAAGMTFNAVGDVVRADTIRRVTCLACGGTRHQERTCPSRRTPAAREIS